MFVFTVHPPKRKHLWLLLPVVGVLLGALLLFLVPGGNTLRLDGDVLNTTVRDEGDIERIADFFGLVPDFDTLQTDTVTIPRQFNVTYEAYERLQQEAGFSLAAYQGKQAVRYTAALKQEETVLTLLVCEGRLIGGDICSRDFFGEQLPLSSRRKKQ